MIDKLILEEEPSNYSNLIPNIVTDGFHALKLREFLLENNEIDMVNNVFNNAKKAMSYFANPLIINAKSKILALGKVQSGKTAFFISTIAYAFDNGYKIAVVLGGTKYNLLNQNRYRLNRDFSLDSKTLIYDLNELDSDTLSQSLEKDKEIIITVLKNPQGNYLNLNKLLSLAPLCNKYPILVIDDEADEFTPGAPKLKTKNPKVGKTHDVIAEIYNVFDIITMLFVTATPQANLLISTLDQLTPDYAVLVEPGNGYTGGEAFHDSENNPRVVQISDEDDFKHTIPESFKESLKLFMLTSIFLKSLEIDNEFSMLIHPSSLTKIQNFVLERIEEEFQDIKNHLVNNRKTIFFAPIKEEFERVFKKYLPNNIYDFEVIFERLLTSINDFSIFVFNTSKTGKDSMDEIDSDKSKFKIFIGGNMLGRGVTIKNLVITYMYRDSKISAVDTLYQRARWFGYKRKYLDFCRVFMTESLLDKFIALAENERDMWINFNEFLETKINLKEFPRFFTLSHDKLILTRKSVSDTKTLERIKAGYSYDLSVYFNDGDIESNSDLVKKIVEDNSNSFYEKTFSSTSFQTHLILETSFTYIYNNFISKYKFQRNSKLGPNTFLRLKNQIDSGILEDKMALIIMRFRTGQLRSIRPYNKELLQLPQGYDPGSGYSGDRVLEGFSGTLHLQVHMVYTDETRTGYKIPILALNNPITKHQIRLVTGDNYYG